MSNHSEFIGTFTISEVVLEGESPTIGLTEGPPASRFQIKERCHGRNEFNLRLIKHVAWDDGNTDIPLTKLDPNDNLNGGASFVSQNSITVATDTSDAYLAHVRIGEDLTAEEVAAQEGAGPNFPIEITVQADLLGPQPGGSAKGGRG